MLAAHLALRHVEKSNEGGDQQRQCVDAMELGYLAVEQRQTHKDEEQMRAEDFDRRAAERDERLTRDKPAHSAPQAVEHADESDDVQQTERPELPLVHQNRQV